MAEHSARDKWIAVLLGVVTSVLVNVAGISIYFGGLEARVIALERNSIPREAYDISIMQLREDILELKQFQREIMRMLAKLTEEHINAANRINDLDRTSAGR